MHIIKQSLQTTVHVCMLVVCYPVLLPRVVLLHAISLRNDWSILAPFIHLPSPPPCHIHLISYHIILSAHTHI
jgi:hypothetical protein